jgi:hypothetical protein
VSGGQAGDVGPVLLRAVSPAGDRDRASRPAAGTVRDPARSIAERAKKDSRLRVQGQSTSSACSAVDLAFWRVIRGSYSGTRAQVSATPPLKPIRAIGESTASDRIASFPQVFVLRLHSRVVRRKKPRYCILWSHGKGPTKWSGASRRSFICAGFGRMGFPPPRSAAVWGSQKMPWWARRTGLICRRDRHRSAGMAPAPLSRAVPCRAQSGRRCRLFPVHSP